MVLQTSKEQFLVNKLNKQRFISALGVALETTSTVVYSKADADLYIVLAAIDCAKTKATALVGEDTDLLILLAHHACPDTHDIVFFRTKRERIPNSGVRNNSYLFLESYFIFFYFFMPSFVETQRQDPSALEKQQH